MYIFLYFFIQRFLKNSDYQHNESNYSINNFVYKIKPAEFKDLSEIIDHTNRRGMHYSEDNFTFNIYEQIYKATMLKTLENPSISIDNKLLLIKNDENLIKINKISNGDLMNDFNYQIDDN